jgi:hypothetical protein
MGRGWIDTLLGMGQNEVMSHSQNSTRPALAACVAVLTIAPLVGAMHYHGVDHSGATLHIETDHGGHFHSPPEMEERQTSQGITPLAVPGIAWTLPEGSYSKVSVATQAPIEHPARPPPSPLRSRAPPLFS